MGAGMQVAIPGGAALDLRHLVLDVNGTLSTDGVLLPGVQERIAVLAQSLECHVISADTHGTAGQIAATLGCAFTQLGTGQAQDQAKRAFVLGLGAGSVAAVGNGRNDALMLATAALGICVIGTEGAAVAALTAADVVSASIADALDLLLNPLRLAGTLRR